MNELNLTSFCFSRELEEEIAFRLDVYFESNDEAIERNVIIRELMSDMDDREDVAFEFRKELQDFGIRIGIFRAYTKGELDKVVFSGHGKKYDFKRKDKFYMFESWKPLEQK